MVDSFLTDADREDFTLLNQQGLETEMTLYPERTLMLELERWVNDDYEVQDPQRVLIVYADRQEEVESNEAGEAVRVDGWFRKSLIDGAFNVRPGDSFSLGPEAADQSGTIISVRAPELGEQRASWILSVGNTNG